MSSKPLKCCKRNATDSCFTRVFSHCATRDRGRKVFSTICSSLLRFGREGRANGENLHMWIFNRREEFLRVFHSPPVSTGKISNPSPSARVPAFFSPGPFKLVSYQNRRMLRISAVGEKWDQMCFDLFLKTPHIQFSRMEARHCVIVPFLYRCGCVCPVIIGL